MCMVGGCFQGRVASFQGGASAPPLNETLLLTYRPQDVIIFHQKNPQDPIKIYHNPPPDGHNYLRVYLH